MLASLVWLSLVDLQTLLVDAVWAGLFAANLRFAATDTDYFSEGLAPSPLQHYWSLGVEEQFYLVWPLLVLARCCSTSAGTAPGPGAACRA